MNIKSNKTGLLLVCSLMFFHVNAQQTIGATGSDASGTGGSISYTVGQIDYLTNAGSNGTTHLGVQQPHEIYSVKVEFESLPNISVFPNPTSDLITIEAENFKPDNLSYQLLDITGKLLISGEVFGAQSSISLASFAPAFYLLVITDNKNFVKTVKINKTNP